MKRFHVHVAVPDLQQGIRFYSTMFGAQPSVVKDDYAKWMLEDPRVNFAISRRGEASGINHLASRALRRISPGQHLNDHQDSSCLVLRMARIFEVRWLARWRLHWGKGVLVSADRVR